MFMLLCGLAFLNGCKQPQRRFLFNFEASSLLAFQQPDCGLSEFDFSGGHGAMRLAMERIRSERKKRNLFQTIPKRRWINWEFVHPNMRE